jgi:hypothetical protein
MILFHLARRFQKHGLARRWSRRIGLVMNDSIFYQRLSGIILGVMNEF